MCVPSDMCRELRSPCILSLSWHACLKNWNKKLHFAKEKYTSSWCKWVVNDGFISGLISASVHQLTFGDDSLQADDVRVRELTHDAGLAQELLSLFLWITWFQGLDRYRHLSSYGSLHHAPKHFPKLSWSPDRQQEEMLNTTLWDFIWKKVGDFKTHTYRRRWLFVCQWHLGQFLWQTSGWQY